MYISLISDCVCLKALCLHKKNLSRKFRISFLSTTDLKVNCFKFYHLSNFVKQAFELSERINLYSKCNNEIHINCLINLILEIIVTSDGLIWELIKLIWNFVVTTLRYGCSHVNFLVTYFPKNTSGRLLLYEVI